VPYNRHERKSKPDDRTIHRPVLCRSERYKTTGKVYDLQPTLFMLWNICPIFLQLTHYLFRQIQPLISIRTAKLLWIYPRNVENLLECDFNSLLRRLARKEEKPYQSN
jgi:hypothetical protein